MGWVTISAKKRDKPQQTMILFFEFGYFFDPPPTEIRLLPVGAWGAQASIRSLTLKQLTSWTGGSFWAQEILGFHHPLCGCRKLMKIVSSYLAAIVD